MLIASPATRVAAGDPTPFSAREGLSLAEEAARAWAEDARLVYIENDRDVVGEGAAGRWGYLFVSRARESARGYSLESGKIEAASDLDFDLDAPALPGAWIDSGDALRAAEADAGGTCRLEEGGVLGSLFLIRGAFHRDDPDAPTWVAVYRTTRGPSVFVVVDARSGKVVRTWRG